MALSSFLPPHPHTNRPVELNQDNIECALELSVRFAVGMLIEQCCNFLASAVAVDTACAILILADVGSHCFWVFYRSFRTSFSM